MTMRLVSIIIPAWNPGPYLRIALESVMAQTFTDWECVVVDDNSKEDLSWVARDFPRVTYVRQGHGGASVARNNGILRTTGKFIAFMDQDDVWRPDKLRRQVAALESDPEAGACYCDLAIIRADGRPWDGSLPVESVSDPAPVLELDPFTASADARSPLARSLNHFAQRFVVPSTVLVRRAALATSGLLDPFIPFSGDYDLLIKVGGAFRVLRVPVTDVLYRKHDNNFSDQYDVGRGEVEALVSRYQAYAAAKGDTWLGKDAARRFRRPRKMYSAQAFDCARRSLRAKDYPTFARHFAKAFYFSPAFVTRSVVRWTTLRAAPSQSSR